MKSSAGRLSQSTVAGFIGAAAFAVLTAGTAVAVSTTAVSITNPTTGVRAHVTGKASLVTSQRDPYSGTYAKVDAGGRQVVGDGSGPLTVDGTVTARTSAPATTFDVVIEGSHMAGQLTGANWAALPGGTINVQTISAKVTVPTGQAVWAYLRYTNRSGQPARHYVPLVRQGSFSPDVYVAAMPLNIWPKPSTQIFSTLTRSAGTGTASITMTISGVEL